MLMERGAAVTDVQQILGHTSLDTTMRYVARKNVTGLAEVVERGPLAA